MEYNLIAVGHVPCLLCPQIELRVYFRNTTSTDFPLGKQNALITSIMCFLPKKWYTRESIKPNICLHSYTGKFCILLVKYNG